MDDDLKPRSIKIGEERWQRWQVAAKVRGISLTAMIIERMEAPEAEDGLPQRDMSRSALEATCDRLDRENGEQSKEIAKLKKALAAAHQVQLSPTRALAVLRGNPAMKAVEPTPDGSKLVAAVLPLTGTEFPARPVYLRGQDPGKGKR